MADEMLDAVQAAQKCAVLFRLALTDGTRPDGLRYMPGTQVAMTIIQCKEDQHEARLTLSVTTDAPLLGPIVAHETLDFDSRGGARIAESQVTQVATEVANRIIDRIPAL